jgi:hypothetical protein
MRLNVRATSSAASALASSRVWLLFGGVLVLSESVVLATTLFAVTGVSFVASLLISAKLYRVRVPRPANAERSSATSDDALPAPAGSRAGTAKPKPVGASA